MDPDWLTIRKARPDLTDYLIHWTKGWASKGGPFAKLKQILETGLLMPTFAPRYRYTVGGTDRTIKGPHPAVCFTEQPLDSFITSCDTLRRYWPYGVAIRKEGLFRLGGRPVFYGDGDLLDSLPDDYKYLWVRFNPIPSTGLGGYPVDWTQEREWRARPSAYTYATDGLCPNEGVPLLLPPDYEAGLLLLPWVIVKTADEVDELGNWIGALSPFCGSNGVLRRYFSILPKVPIVSIEQIREGLRQGDDRWRRIDTLPYEEVNPSGAKELRRLGWRPLSA